MEILTEHSFKTVQNVTITGRRENDDGSVSLHFEGIHETYFAGKSHYPIALAADEADALTTLISGGELEVRPNFVRGDLVRAANGLGITENGALAEVTSESAARRINVRWLDTRATNADYGYRQSDGVYYASLFSKVARSELTEEDYRSLAEQALDNVRWV